MPFLTFHQNPLLKMILDCREEGADFFSMPTDPASYRRGVQYYHSARTTDLGWSEDQEKLIATVRGSEFYRVEFYLKKVLRMNCSCPLGGDETLLCKHLICAFLTILEICGKPYGGRLCLPLALRNRLGIRLKDREFDDDFDAPIAGNSKTSKKVCIEIHLRGPLRHGFWVDFLKAGKAIRYPSKAIPALLQASPYYYGNPSKIQISENRFFEFLKFTTEPFKIFIHMKNGVVAEAAWAPKEILTAESRMNLQDSKILFQRLALNSKGQAVESAVRLSKNLYFLPAGKIMGKIKNVKQWELIESIQQKLRRGDFQEETFAEKSYNPFFEEDSVPLFFEQIDESLTVSPEEFLPLSPLFPREETESFWSKTRLESGGHPVSEMPQERAGVEVHFQRTDMDSLMQIGLQSVFPGGVSYPSDPELFEPFLSVYGRAYLSKTNRAEILKVFFQELLKKDGSLDPDFKESTSAALADSPYTAHLRYAAEHLLDPVYRFLTLGTERTQLTAAEGKWHWFSHDLLRLFRIFGICHRLFGKGLGDYFINPAKPLLIKTKDFYHHLRTFQAFASLLNVKVFLDRKPIETVSVSFHVEARDSGEDWFELHPEVKLGERLLGQEEWKRLLAESHQNYFEFGGKIQILESNAASLAAQFERLLYGSQKTFPGSQEANMRIPRLQILDWIALRKSGISVSLPQAASALMEKLMNFEKIQERETPAGFLGQMRDYQKKGYEWLAFHYEYEFGACLADDMGLGKTVQAIAFLGALKEGKVTARKAAQGKPHLIVVPPTLLFNWQQEIKKFYPSLTVEIYAGSERQWNPQGKDIILTSYDLIRHDFDEISKTLFHVILFDEAQMVKNIRAKRAQFARQLQGCFRICLTGTPFENHLGEYYAILDLCVPGLLGEYEEFKNHLARTQMRETLVHRTRPFVLRRTKEKILKELPAKTESDFYLDLSDKQKAIYVKMVQEVRPKVEQAYAEKTAAQARIIFLTALLRLRQICVSPQLVVPSFKERSPKMEYLINTLKELSQEGHACIIFSQFAKCLHLAGKELHKEKIAYLHMDGTTPMRKRQEMVAQFQDPQGPAVFLVSLKTGGMGLNLTRASYVFHLDPWWNPAVDRQASDRVHRIGQTKAVFIQRILMRHSVEEKVMSLRKSKEELFRQIMDEGLQSGTEAGLTRRDIEYLLT